MARVKILKIFIRDEKIGKPFQILTLMKLLVVFVTAFLGMVKVAYADDVVLIVSFLPVGKGDALLRQYYHNNFPSHRIVVAGLQSPDVFTSAEIEPTIEKLRESMGTVFKFLLKPGDRITHLVLRTHANTFKNIEAAGGMETKLQGIGTIDSEEVSKEFKGLFEPIRNLFSKSLTVVLDGCWSLCGRRESAIRRAEVLVDYLGAKNGRVFGATTMQELHGQEFQTLKEKFERVITTGRFYRQVKSWIRSALGIRNFGIVIDFIDGQVESVTSGRKMDLVDQIYGGKKKDASLCIKSARSTSL